MKINQVQDPVGKLEEEVVEKGTEVVQVLNLTWTKLMIYSKRLLSCLQCWGLDV
jgi:hypothetical protein